MNRVAGVMGQCTGQQQIMRITAMPGGAFQIRVMQHEQLVIPGQAHIQLDF